MYGVIEIFWICLSGVVSWLVNHYFNVGIGSYVICGTLMGKYVFNLINISYLSDTLSTIGILFLLFEVGLHMSYEKILILKKHLFTSILSISLSFLGLSIILHFSFPKITGLLFLQIIMVFVISSTPIGLYLLEEKNQIYTNVGRLIFTTILLQDVLSIILLCTISEGNNLSIILLKFLIFIIVLMTLIKKIIYNTFKKFNDNFNIILLFTCFMIIGLSIITEHLGLSMELGAFLAGLLLVDTEYKYQIESHIVPLKGVLLALFFMTVGMNFDLNFFINNFYMVIMFFIMIFFCKFITISLGGCYKLSIKKSIRMGIILLSSGEMVFIFLSHIKIKYPLFINYFKYIECITVISMILSTLIYNIYEYFSTYEKKIDENYQLVIIGITPVTEIIVKILQINGIDYICIDKSFNKINDFKNKNYNTLLCDINDYKIISSFVKNASGFLFLNNISKNIIHSIRVKPVFIKVNNNEEAKKYKNTNIIPIHINFKDEAEKICECIFPILGIHKDEIKEILEENY
ncbi:hypothetical protein AB836_02055 [Rickettsiales bacterium (ex Bugula neritina AB1)]|nr:hypothetical protein AB836_02055 [Rickettsiales bacterium (ex Bugula neritina AB1)]